ncbi:centrosomal protein of 85 kDa-like [Gigantopelta aegis]|uniref:centrosomal protein of 85 kDa-like n=1 Tax=Gigantopelta aegis TaxID=1735272 RepID=UPI001B88DCD3|nr:centrosomal protein of 85 kDa-like [Gigantopelta aegis]XP_041353809.1 centrosomal protein of 85 kDa-like [Gigantopelta aegis]
MFHQADIPGKVPALSSNISDYEKMLQNQQYIAGYRDVPSGSQMLMPTPSVRGPSSVDSGYETQNYSRRPSSSAKPFGRTFTGVDVDSSAVTQSYNPGKYGVVTSQQFYDTSYFPKELQNPVASVDYQSQGILRDRHSYTISDRQHDADHGFHSDNQIKQPYSNVYVTDEQQTYSVNQSTYPAGQDQARNRHSCHGEEYDTDYTSPMTTPPTLSEHNIHSTYQSPVKSQSYVRADYYDVAHEPAGYGRSASSSSLQQWQQQHKDHLLQQQLESQALYGGSQTSIEGVFQQLRLKEEDSARLDPVRRAADNIIREKDAVINRLKKHVFQLEDDKLSLEKKLRHSLTGREGREESGQMRIQELQHKIACLKNELIASSTQKNEDIDSLENKLGATEFENSQLRKALKEKQAHVDSSISQLSEKERELGEWKSKCLEMKESHLEARKKLDQLELYLGDLPTAEAMAQTEMKLHKVKQQHQQSVMQVEDLETKLSDTRKQLTARDFTEQELQLTVKRLSDQVDDLTSEVDSLRSEGVGATLYQIQEELQEMREEKERLAIDLEKAKRLLEKTVRNLRRSEQKYQNDVRQLSEQLSHEEESVTLLREDIASKDELIENLRKNIKELGSENQDLMEENLITKEHLQHFEAQLTDESVRLQRRLMIELGLCFSNLQSLVQICMQRVNGEDPNMSILLGINSSSSEADDLPTKVEGQTLKHWLTRVAELREEIDKLRGIICNKYAEDMGDNLTCNPQ